MLSSFAQGPWAQRPSMRVNSLRNRHVKQPDLFMQDPLGIGLAHLDGYFSIRLYDSASASDSFQPRSPNAQTTSGDVQPGAGTAPHSERPNRFASELSFLRGEDRERTQPLSASTAFSRNAQMHRMRQNRAVHRGSRLADQFFSLPNHYQLVRSVIGSARAFLFPRGARMSLRIPD